MGGQLGLERRDLGVERRDDRDLGPRCARARTLMASARSLSPATRRWLWRSVRTSSASILASAALTTFPDLDDRDALAVLVRAPTPDLAKRLSLAKIGSALRAGGRKRNIDIRAAQIAEGSH